MPNSLRILVVDDEEIVHRSLRRAQQRGRIDAELQDANNGAEALELLSGQPSDTPIVGVLLDINMPIMDGFEFLSKVRASADYDHLKIIMLSSSDEPSDYNRAMKLGADGYQVKSSANSLVEAISRLKEIVGE